MSKKFQKLILQYAYLELEQEEIDEACNSVETEMREYMKKNYPEQFKNLWKENTKTPDEQNNPESIPEESEAPEEETRQPIPKNKDLKKLYRKIAEKTHPDKVGSNQYVTIFSDSAAAYATNDLAKLMQIAGGINIEIIELSPESIKLVENNIKEIAEAIYHKKQTTAWAWSQSTTGEEKDRIVKNILSSQGISL